MSECLAIYLPNWFQSYLAWWVALVIVVGGIALFGLDDLRRLSPRRIWAISSVCFAESVRRKVLGVVPLAIVGVIIVTVLQHALDPQEAIRQTVKFCLFASGLIVTITAVILACTNLPREIENRVIFTIVTKPTTRLEIVLGKIVGFIRVSGLIVLIMGIFSFAYLGWQNSRLSSQLTERLKNEKDESTRQTLLGYQTAGLLSTKSLETAADLQIFEHGPSATGVQWLTGSFGYTFVVPFDLSAEDKALLGSAASDPEHMPVLIIDTLKLNRHQPDEKELKWITSRNLPLESQVIGPVPGAQQPVPVPIPQLLVQVLDKNMTVLVAQRDINSGKPASAKAGIPRESTNPYSIPAYLDPATVHTLIEKGSFYVQSIPDTNSVEYEVSSTPTVLDVIDAGGKEHVIRASGPPRFLSTAGRYGMKIIGNSKGEGSVAMFRFSGAQVPSAEDKPVAFRFRAGMERSGDFDATKPWSIVTLTVVNRDTNQSSGPIEFHPETNQDFPVSVPREFVKDGNFDVFIRGMDSGQFIGLTPTSVQLISAEHSFVLNLLASLLILWLMSVLVVVIAIFTSTFLSWPIAIVLTLLILLGHWGVQQLGDTMSPGMGRSVASDLGMQTPTEVQFFSHSVDVLSKGLGAAAMVLPDLSKFPVMENITRGIATPPRQIAGAIGVLLSYGLPMLVISFIILKNKEVAP